MSLLHHIHTYIHTYIYIHIHTTYILTYSSIETCEPIRRGLEVNDERRRRIRGLKPIRKAVLRVTTILIVLGGRGQVSRGLRLGQRRYGGSGRGERLLGIHTAVLARHANLLIALLLDILTRRLCGEDVFHPIQDISQLKGTHAQDRGYIHITLTCGDGGVAPPHLI